MVKKTKFSFFFFQNNSFLKTFEGALEDIDENLTTDISSCFKSSGEAGNLKYEPINCQGTIAQSILGKKVHTALIQLHCPLQDLNSLIPSNVDLGMRNTLSNQPTNRQTDQPTKKIG